MSKAKEQHEKELKKYANELESKGHKVILLNEKSPDGICIDWEKKNVFAIECLGKSLQSKGKYKGKYAKEGKVRYAWRLDGGFTFAMKRRNYSMFDDVLFSVYYRTQTDNRKLNEKELAEQQKYKFHQKDFP
jgi:hypothetical protein